MTEKEKYTTQVERILRLRNLTEGTVNDYILKCRRYFEWCDGIGVDPADINIEQVQNYILSLKDIFGYSPKTINSNISFVRLFFNYVLYRPLDRYMLPYQRVDLKEPEILSKEEVVQFINALPNLKAKAMVILLYACGLRSSEVVSLKYSDISRERKTVYIEHTKNRSARYVPLSDTALAVLTAYWKNNGKPKGWLFPGVKPNSHIRKDTLFAYIKDTKIKLGWTERHITSHTFRHCIGTHMYEDGCDLPYIQKFLGHKSITSTMVYITVNGNRIYQNPLDKVGGVILG